MLYNLGKDQSIMVYGYLPGAWAGVVGGLLILTPLMCIPVFLFISLCMVGGIRSPAKTGVTVSLKLIFFFAEFPKHDHTFQRSAPGSTAQASPHAVWARRHQVADATQQEGGRIRQDDCGGDQRSVMKLHRKVGIEGLHM